jgi:hypothetical protein
LKIGLPRLRLSRKLLIVTLGVTVFLGGTGVTALYFGGKTLMLEGGESAIGGECTDIQTVVVKTPSDHLWLRKFIRMENASGPERIRTALRISGLLAKKHAVDLIHVSVLDKHGPTLRSQMRARSIGAEVLIALKPENLPEMTSPAMASYYEGPVSDGGRYYGDKVVVDIDEIGAMMTAMRTIEEKPDCVTPASETDEAAKPGDSGEKEEKEGQGSKEEAKPADHGATPKEPEGEKPADADGGEPEKEESFLNSMLNMVGLGGSEEKPPAADNSHAVAEEPVDDAKPADHGDKTAAEDHAPAAKEGGHDTAEKPAKQEDGLHSAVEGAGSKDAATDHADTGDKAEAHDASAPVEQEPAAPPADDEDHSEQEKPKADEHAEVNMPVGD